jgi:hypothetical protein
MFAADVTEKHPKVQQYFQHVCQQFHKFVTAPRDNPVSIRPAYKAALGPLCAPRIVEMNEFKGKKLVFRPALVLDGKAAHTFFFGSGYNSQYPILTVFDYHKTEFLEADIIIVDREMVLNEDVRGFHDRLFHYHRSEICKHVPEENYVIKEKHYVTNAQRVQWQQDIADFQDTELLQNPQKYGGKTYDELYNSTSQTDQTNLLNLRALTRLQVSYTKGHGFTDRKIGYLLLFLIVCQMHAEHNFVKYLALNVVFFFMRLDIEEERFYDGNTLEGTRLGEFLKSLTARYETLRWGKRVQATVQQKKDQTKMSDFSFRLIQHDGIIYLNLFWKAAHHALKQTANEERHWPVLPPDFQSTWEYLALAHRLTQQHSFFLSQKLVEEIDIFRCIMCGSDIMKCLELAQASPMANSVLYLKVAPYDMAHLINLQYKEHNRPRLSVGIGLVGNLQGGEKKMDLIKQTSIQWNASLVNSGPI